ncbi:Oxidoreductase UcpA [Hypsizygus marmoreus]|uniref:Oxidoreductase UcpA n=1 Tax=Hypsizygus marmoreus TaxID=39966 RepID=A0A369JP93_HYPMA|nr:Oxidoreductase UcpA [Hypsizygus marmoreus]
MGNESYVHADVRDQGGMWQKVGEVGEREGRMNMCVACAGIVKQLSDCLRVSAEEVKEVLDVNINGVLFTAQAVGQQMVRFGNPGSIVLISSVAGSVVLRGDSVIAYHASKSALLQMARSMACELASRKSPSASIRYHQDTSLRRRSPNTPARIHNCWRSGAI